jgi:hypothetical protein
MNGRVLDCGAIKQQMQWRIRRCRWAAVLLFFFFLLNLCPPRTTVVFRIKELRAERTGIQLVRNDITHFLRRAWGVPSARSTGQLGLVKFEAYSTVHVSCDQYTYYPILCC